MKIPFFRLGCWQHPHYGILEITQRIFDDIILNFEAGAIGRRVFIRLGHDKDSSPVFGGGEAVAWVEEIKQEGELLVAYATPVDEAAGQLIATGRYLYASAEYNDPGTNRENGNLVGALLSAIALTNEPFLTKLPETTLLAMPSGEFLLDYQMATQNKKEDKIVEKVLETIQNGFAELKKLLSGGASPPVGGEQNEQQKLAEAQAANQKVLAEMASLKEQLATTAKQAQAEVRLAQTEKEAAEMVALGIPPVMVEKWKALAQLEEVQGVIKLADPEGKETELSQAAAIKEMLLSMPADHRIQIDQKGSQAQPSPEDKVHLACVEDVKAMGGTVTEDGKFKI